MLDGLVKGGLALTNAHAHVPLTLPSHATLMTGRLPPALELHDNAPFPLRGDVPTLASWLQARGYATDAVIGGQPLARGSGIERGFDEFDDPPRGTAGVTRFGERKAAEVTDHALVAWTRSAGDRPRFLFVHYFDPHSDYSARPEYVAMFARDYDGPIDGSTGQLLSIRAEGVRLAGADLEHLTALYDAEIRQLDDQLARLFRALDERGLSDRTLVVITSDHGEELMEHGSVLHGRTMYQEVIGIPLLVRGPGVPRGMRVAQNVSLTDLMPTLLEVLAIAAPAGLEGRSVVDYWRRPDPQQPGHLAFAEADWMNAQPDAKRMVRHGSHKLHLDRISDATELYDLAADPREQKNLGAQQPDRVRQLREELDVFSRTERAPVTIAPPTGDVLDRLRALGYAQ